MNEIIYDAAVFGGGFRGLGAALPLLEAGLKVIIVENRPSLGWEAVWGRQLELTRGVSKTADIIAGKISAFGGMRGDRIDPMAVELKTLELFERAQLLFYCRPAAVMVENGLARAVVMAGKSGLFPVTARAYIDATEDCSLSALLPGAEIKKPVCDDKLFSFFLYHSGEKPALPKAALNGMLIKKTVWDSETAVEFKSASEMYWARTQIPELLETVGAEIKGFEKAFLSQASFAELPLNSPVCGRNDNIKNVFSAGRGEGLFSFGDRDNLLAARALEGEKTSAEVKKIIDSLPRPAAVRGPLSAEVRASRNDDEVTVCGGGTGGAVAAISSARHGAKTRMIEASACLGGIGTGGGIHTYYHGVRGGVQDEIDAAADEMTAAFKGDARISGFHPEAKKIVLQRFAAEAGVSIDFERIVCGAETEDAPETAPARKGDAARKNVKSVIVCGPEGQVRVGAKIVVDATGDGDAAAMAGCAYTFGRDSDALPHAYSQPAARMVKDAGGPDRFWMLNFDAGYCDPTTPFDLTAARAAGLRLYDRGPVTEETRFMFAAPALGLRNSRLFKGGHRISLADQIKCSEFPDVIAYSHSHYDNHANDYENESFEAMLWVWGAGHWRTLIGCEIPYRSIVPEGAGNILMACRAASMDHDAHNQLRMERDMQRLGEAAGTAAALCVKNNCRAHALDVKELQAELCKTGALLSPETGYHCGAWKPKELMSGAPRTLPVSPEDRAGAILAAAGGKEELERRFSSADKDEKYSAALLLSGLGLRDCSKELIACAREKHPLAIDTIKKAPLWKPAVAVLGERREKAAVPVLEEILSDENADQAALILALNALGKIGVSSASAAVRRMLGKDGLPSEYKMQSSCAAPPVTVDTLWKLELAAAETLALLGDPAPEIFEKYLNDPRAFVRRSARRRLERSSAAALPEGSSQL